MKKDILIISASPRKGGNSDLLCDAFIQGAMDSGHQTEKIFVQHKTIKGCFGCEICKSNESKCIHMDDMPEILSKMIDKDIIVLATPVYFYSMDGQLKTLIDRTYSRYTEMNGKDFYFILTGGAPDKSYMETAIAGLQGFVDCIPESKTNGIIYGVGTVDKGDVKTMRVMETAYKMGKEL